MTENNDANQNFLGNMLITVMVAIVICLFIIAFKKDLAGTYVPIENAIVSGHQFEVLFTDGKFALIRDCRWERGHVAYVSYSSENLVAGHKYILTIPKKIESKIAEVK